MSDTTAPNEAKRAVYAELARGKKVVALVASIDAGLALLKVDPFSAQALEYVLVMTDAAWKLAAAVACVNLPSLETRHLVLECFRRRVRASVDAQIAAAVAGALKAVGT